MERILVIGAGYMGAGIAQVCAQSGRTVELNDASPENLARAMEGMKQSLGKLASKGLINEAPDDVLARVIPVSGLEGAAAADMIMEVVFEKEDLKKELFARLEEVVRPDVIIASNTSSIPISRLAEGLQHPERVIGIHFFGPVPLMGVAEVIKGEKTSDEVFQRGLEFVRSVGKSPVKVKKDVPMFVLNRIFFAAFQEASKLVDEGVVSMRDLDLGMRLGYGWVAGPFEVADNAGLDTYQLIQRSMQALGEADAGDNEVDRLVAQGRVGRKVGRGFYDYTPEGKRIVPEDDGNQ